MVSEKVLSYIQHIYSAYYCDNEIITEKLFNNGRFLNWARES